MSYDLISLAVNREFKNLKDNSEATLEEVDWENLDGVSLDNEYFPSFSVVINKGVYGKKVVHYGIPSKRYNSNSLLKTYPKFFRALEYYSLPVKFKTSTMTFDLYCFKGCIYCIENDIPKVLFMVGIKTSHIPNLGRQTFPEDYVNYAIFVSYDFANDAKYRNVYKKVYDTVVLSHIQKGVEFRITNNIEKRYFKNNNKPPKFKTFKELDEYLQSFNKIIANERT